MPLEYLENPRKAPRVRARCRVALTAPGVALQGLTEDVGPHGCQLVVSAPLPRGTALALVLRAAQGADPVQVEGAVAWCSPRAPWRLGIAFSEPSRREATRFFDQLVAAQPGLASWRKVPDRISYDAMVWLAPPPRLVVDFTPEEVVVLRSVGTGATVFELKSRLRDRWAISQRAFFSLLTSQFLTLSRGGSVPFANWSNLLHELEADLAAASLGELEPAPEPTWSPAPAPAADAGAVELVAPPPALDSSAGLDMDPATLELDVGPGGPGPGGRRPAEAQEAYQQALGELAAGRRVSAGALLRRALALAPGDVEIARTLGEVTFGQR
jgi:hypothetical protein